VHGDNDPIENPGEPDKACDPSEAERVQRGFALEAEEERDESYPRQGIKREVRSQHTEGIGKTCDQKNTRQEGRIVCLVKRKRE